MNGKALSEQILGDLRLELHKTQQTHPSFATPTLCVVTVAPQPATQVYLKHKKQAAESIGFHFKEVSFPESVSQADLTQGIAGLARDAQIHGIIVQLPIPEHLSVWEVVQSVPPEKDVDGLNAHNQGCIQVGLPCLLPCTPQGVMELLFHYDIIHPKRSGLHAVVIGRSPLVGKPIANLLLGREGNCTVTVLHRGIKDLSVFTKHADIVVAAVGKAGLVTPDMVKEGAVVVDVGINFIPSTTLKSGKKMVGDVDPAVYPKTRAYTPVPGGVGPMTVAMLMRNVLTAAQRLQGVSPLHEGWRGLARVDQ
eukprot:TRINITY_DN1117_c0_g1_i1.p1 TRINITY_DN1117_c0_g1~~TRINITY_DN1117_c0_g1_i1.p1  ORF type:complete len:322 (-),score=39.09 TRINITY_DN1117_c0_g1_i1:88-1011(-)